MVEPDTLRSIGFSLLVAGLLGDIAVLFIPANRRTLEKSLAILFIAIIISGVSLERIGDANLARLQGPRNVTADDTADMVAKLRPFAGRSYDLSIPPTLEPGSHLIGQLLYTLKMAGWKLTSIRSAGRTTLLNPVIAMLAFDPPPQGGRLSDYIPAITVGVNVGVVGVKIAFGPNSASPADTALYQALAVSNIATEFELLPDAGDHDTTTHIIVGSKP